MFPVRRMKRNGHKSVSVILHIDVEMSVNSLIFIYVQCPNEYIYITILTLFNTIVSIYFQS